MTNIVVLGSEGMLGKAVVHAALANELVERVFSLTRRVDITNLTSLNNELKVYDERDTVINCAGKREADPLTMSMVNATAPHLLAEMAAIHGFRLIHVSTDCVYSTQNEYRAPAYHTSHGSPPAPQTLYGRTKLAGEPISPTTTVVRTSFVGPDHGLWRWVAGHPPGPIVGWTKAWWSGSTVWNVAERLITIANEGPPSSTSMFPKLTERVVNLATKEAITKHEAVRLLIKHLKRTDLELVPAPMFVDRSMSGDWYLDSFEDALEARDW